MFFQKRDRSHPSIQRSEEPFFRTNNVVQARLKKNSAQSSDQRKTKTDSATDMPSNLQSGLESLSGENLSGVRVHRNSSKPNLVDAHAYTQGKEIYLAPGQESHLPHEGWHVVQQMQGRVQPTIQKKSSLINDDASLEREADIMGERALSSGNHSGSKQKGKSRIAQRSDVIQRAMKFEYQFKKNFLYRDLGNKTVKRLPRKYGPRDYIVRASSGARLESETSGQIEFETSWEKKWSKMHKQIKDIQYMSHAMNKAPNVSGSDGKTYKKFPFDWALKHLSTNKGFATSNGRWNKYQKNGEAEVKSRSDSKENFRSSTSYESDENIIRTIDNGKKVFVHYNSSNGLWSRIQYKGQWGWMWKASLTGMENKSYESNKDNKGVYSDTPLKSKEKILVKVGDSEWKPYVQISESFKLEQYESYLKQYDKTLGPGLISGTNKYLLDHNSDQGPKGESFMTKYFREKAFLNEHIKLKNLLLMVGHYIEKGRTQTTLHSVKQKDGSYKKEPGSAKYALSLLNRTHFGSIFNSLSKKEQVLFKQMVYDTKTGIIPTMKLTTSSKMFMDGTGTGYNPTVYSWLISISKGGDILSVQSGKALPAAMGKKSLNKEDGKSKGLVRFEARNEPDNFPKLWDIDDHALRHFTAAATKRAREQGKGKTGLEL